MQRKKLQVFVSSTFTDLKEERQAAVEAILTAGHIPAGMELFAAGDQSQMDVIRRWISESDVFLLILGGRYGSIDQASGKSYIQLEYEHALSEQKPFFAVVAETEAIEEKVRRVGSLCIETDNKHKLADFRRDVTTRMVRFWRDPRDIKLAILEALAEYVRREDLVGWTRSDLQTDSAAVAKEIARLSQENTSLRSELSRAVQTQQQATYQGLTFDEYYRLLAAVPVSDVGENISRYAEQTAQVFADRSVGLLHLLWVLSRVLRLNFDVVATDPLRHYLERLYEFGVVRRTGTKDDRHFYTLTEAGNQFLLRLRIARDGVAADDCVIF